MDEIKKFHDQIITTGFQRFPLTTDGVQIAPDSVLKLWVGQQSGWRCLPQEMAYSIFLFYRVRISTYMVPPDIVFHYPTYTLEHFNRSASHFPHNFEAFLMSPALMIKFRWNFCSNVMYFTTWICLEIIILAYTMEPQYDVISAHRVISDPKFYCDY